MVIHRVIYRPTFTDTTMDSRPSSPAEAQILVVEDNPGDIRLMEEAFRDGRITNQLHILTNGREALDFIGRQGEYEDAPRPDMVLLDLNLPQVDGEDLLHEIKHHPQLGGVPVIVLTGVDEALIESRDLRGLLDM